MIVENRRARAHMDWPLIIMVFAMAIFGVLSVCVATFAPGDNADASLLSHIVSSNYAVRQCVFLVVGVVVITVLSNFPYDLMKRMTPMLYLGGTVLVLVVWVFNRAEGVKAWLDIIWGYTIQPSEFIKLAMILMMARVLSRKERPCATISETIRTLAIVGVPCVVILASGEMGSLLVIVFFSAIMMYFANVPMKTLGILAGMVVGAVLALYLFLTLTNSDSYRLARIAAFIDPELYSSTDAYQMRQSQVAIGSGGLHGIGIFVDGAMSQLNYVPADWTDFIFATIGEAFGFVGCCGVLGMYLLIFLRILYLGYHTRDRFGQLVIYGVFGMLLFHVMENIGMTMGLLPITGIPLPFLSYGGSSMTTNMGGIALVLNVTKNRSLTSSIITPQVTAPMPYMRGRRL